MDEQEIRAKAWEKWKKNLLYSTEKPEFSFVDFAVQRGEPAFHCWREARIHERNREFDKARALYLKAFEYVEQAEKQMEHPQLPPLLEKLKNEYFEFAVNRDPKYRQVLQQPLMWLKNNPGVLQTKIYDIFLDHKKEDLAYAFHFAEKEGLIRREEKGCSYQLFYLRDKADAAILKLEYDEYDNQFTVSEMTGWIGCWMVFVFFVWFMIPVSGWAFGGLVGFIIGMVIFVLLSASFTYFMYNEDKRENRNKKE